MPRRSPRLIVLVVALLALALVGGGIATAALRAGGVERDVLARFTNPRGADGRTMYLQRVTIPADTLLPDHFHDGSQIGAVVEGTLRYTVIRGGIVRVVESDPTGQKPAVVHEIRPGETYDVTAGHAVVEPAGMVHHAQAVGGHRVVVYVSSLLVNGAPLSQKVTV